MAKIIDEIRALPAGACIYKKRYLNYLKRNHVIEDYSFWGYLEYNDYWTRGLMLPAFNGVNFTTRYVDGCFNAYLFKQ